MGAVTVRFVDGPAHGTTRQLPAGPDGQPPARWVLGRTEGLGQPAGGPPEHLYERSAPDSSGTWTMRFVRTDAVGMTE